MIAAAAPFAEGRAFTAQTSGSGSSFCSGMTICGRGINTGSGAHKDLVLIITMKINTIEKKTTLSFL